MRSKTVTPRTASKVPDSDDILEKADALMRRRRVFVAGAAEEPLPEPTETAAEDVDDIPVLTDVVPDETVVAQRPQGAAAGGEAAGLRDALAAELDAWLDEELPGHVMRVLDGVTDQMIGHISAKARAELLVRLQARLGEAETPAPEAPDEG